MSQLVPVSSACSRLISLLSARPRITGPSIVAVHAARTKSVVHPPHDVHLHLALQDVAKYALLKGME